MSKYRAVYIIFFILFVLVQAGFAAKYKVVLSEDFSDNRNKWIEKDTKDYYTKIKNGKFHLKNKKNKGTRRFWQKVNIKQNKNFTIEASIEKISGKDNQCFGITWGGDGLNFYSFMISGNGHYMISNYIKNNWTYPISWTKSQYINTDKTANKLKIKRSGKKIKLFVNDKYLNQIDFKKFFGNNIGMFTCSGLEIKVDELFVYEDYSESELASEYKTIFKENFNDNRKEWLVGNTNGRNSKIKGGKFYLKNKTGNKTQKVWKEVNIDQNRDFRIKAVIEKISGPDNKCFGITWGGDGHGNFYSFLISGNGSYMIADLVNNKWTYPISWTSSKHVNSYKRNANELEVFKTGDTVQFFINGEYLNKVKFKKFKGNRISIINCAGIEVEVDDLVVYEALEDFERGSVAKKEVGYKSNKKSEREAQALPPDIYIENLKFIEPSGNKALDGLEKGSVRFDLVNKGRGCAYNIEIKITPLTSAKNLYFNTTTKINRIDKKSRERVLIPISADIELKALKREFRIEALEQYGFDSDPAIISFETQAFARPDLRIDQIAIDDNEDREGEGFSYGNGNSIIEPNESVEVTAYVQNLGLGNALDVKAKVLLDTDNQDITCPDQSKVFNLGDIKSGDYRKLEFYFYTSRRYDADDIPISIKLLESTGIFGKTSDLGLKLGKRTRNIVEVKIAKVKTEKRAFVREIKELAVVSDVDKDIPKTNADGKNTLAIIIGVEEYKYAPVAMYASNDAGTFYRYAKSVFQIPEKNIYYRINDGATSGEFSKIFAEDGWIARRLKKKKTDIIIYYSGHGAPDPGSKKGYLIPYDIDPNYPKTGFSLDKIYSSLSKLQAKSITVFMDACFSGESRSKKMLIAGVRPLSIQLKNPVLKSEDMAVFTASTGEQYSSSYPEKQHGLFTYYLLKGLKGQALGKDKELTLEELFLFIKEKVSLTAGYLDREQTPTFIGKDMTRVLIKY